MTKKHSNHKIKVVKFSDAHCPFEDEKVIELWFAWCNDEQPDIIVLDEWHDFYDLSKFDKDPQRIGKLQEELDIVYGYFKRLRDICPRSRIILLNSNHLERLRKYLWYQAPALSGLKALNIEQLLRLKELKIEFMEQFTYKKVLFKHGDIVRKFSAYTAKGEFEKEGMSGVSGHTHRGGIYFIRLRGGFYMWMEGGCGCNLDPEYVSGITNWIHGFSLVSFDKESNHFYPMFIPIIDYRLDWGNKTYTA